MAKFNMGLFVLLSAFLLSCKHDDNSTPPSVDIDRADNSIVYKASNFLKFKPFIEFSKMAAYQGKVVVMQAVTPVQPSVNESEIEYSWEIADSDGVVILSENTSGPVSWVPDDHGVFHIKLSLLFENEKTDVLTKYTVLEAVDYPYDAGVLFQQVVDKFSGEWIGKVYSPWNNPLLASVSFDENGSFVSKTHSASYINGEYVYRAQTFYYVDDGDSPFNRYEISDLLANGSAIGELHSESRTLELKNIRYSSDLNSLFFEVWNDSYGPIELSLSRYIPLAEKASLSELKESIVGKWVGSSESPWKLPYEVSFEFLSDGTYSSSAEAPSAFSDGGKITQTSALYYGTDTDSQFKYYDINNITEGGLGEGEIDIVFDTGVINRGRIEKIEFSENGLFLKFDFLHRNEFGPVKYLLQRQ